MRTTLPLAVIMLLVVPVFVAGHPAPSPAGGFTRMLHDCNDDQPGGDVVEQNGHDLIALDIKEINTSAAAQDHFLVLRLFVNSGFNPTAPADYITDRIQWDGPGGPVTVVVRAQRNESNPDFGHLAHKQIFTADPSDQFIWSIGKPVNYLKEGSNNQSDLDRAYVDIFLRLADLGYAGGETLTNFFVQGYVRSSQAQDAMPAPSSCASPDTYVEGETYYNAGSYTITGYNRAPTAAFSFSPSAIHSRHNVEFFGDASDPDGDDLTYFWNFGDGSNATTLNPRHRFEPGTYTVRFTVTDEHGLSATATRQMQVAEPPNGAPTAAFSGQSVGLTLTLNASATSDPDDDPLQYDWNFGDGETATGMVVSHTYETGGEKQVTLSVSDGELVDTVTRTILVLSDTKSPIPSIRVEPAAPTTNETFVLTGFADDDGSIESWKWRIDAKTFEEQQISYALPRGDHVIRLDVTDDDGLTGSAHVTLRIRDPAPPPGQDDEQSGEDLVKPVANFLTRPVTPQVGQEVTFLDRSQDNVAVVSWAWDLGDGTNTTERNPRHAYSEAGRYEVVLTVRDAAGLEDSHMLAVTVVGGSSGSADNSTPGASPLLLLLGLLAVAGRRR